MDGIVLPAVLGANIDYRAEDVLYDDHGIKILNEFVITNKNGEQSVFMEVQNSSDQNLYAAATQAEVNGILCSSAAGHEMIVAGKRGVMSISLENMLGKNYMEKLDMKAYKNFKCYFGVEDEGGNALGGKDIEIAFGGSVNPEDFASEMVYDANGFKIMNVGVVKDSSEYSDDLHLLLLVKNETNQVVDISDSFYVFYNVV